MMFSVKSPVCCVILLTSISTFLTPTSLQSFTTSKPTIKCGQIITVPFSTRNGTITSPSWPRPYPQNISCHWEIYSSAGTYIRLIVTQMDIYDNRSTNYCDDYLSVIVNGQSPFRYCGQHAFRQYTPDNVIKLALKAGTRKSMNTGFSATFKILARKCPTSNLTGMTGIISSPNYPDYYPTNIRCDWFITVPRGYRVSLVMKDMHLAYENCGKSDYIILYDGTELSDRVIAWLCAPFIPMSSSGNVMRVRFISDQVRTGKGFSALYRAVLLPTQKSTPPPTSPPYVPLYHEGLYQGLSDVTIAGHALMTITAPSVVTCVLRCQQSVDCLSLTYVKALSGRHGHCKIYNISLQNEAGNIQRDNDAIYYQKLVV